MRNVWKLMATFVLVTALAVPGYAGQGNGNGGGKNNKPKKEKKEKGPKGPKGQKGPWSDAGTSASYSIGQVIVTDSRVLDLSGDYLVTATLTGTNPGTASLALSLTQDDRGRLVGTSTFSLPDGSTTEVLVSGGLQLTAQTNLNLNLEGTLGTDEETSAAVQVTGEWDGSAFQSVVTLTYLDEVHSFDAVIVPVNPISGFIIEEASNEQLKGKKIWGQRTVILPWGEEKVRSQQMNKKGFTFMMHSGDFGIDLRGTVDETSTVTLSRAKLHLGYGSLAIDPDTITVLPAVQ